MKKSYKEFLHQINTFVFDIDGVFTDGTVLVTQEGHLLRSVSVRDGLAVKLALEAGYHVCLISGGTNPGVVTRFEALGVTDIYMGATHKREPYQAYIQKIGVKNHQVLYMGDDLPDLPVMDLVGLATCPQNAIPEVKMSADYVSPFLGGQGCVRDVIEQVMKVNGHWPVVAKANND